MKRVDVLQEQEIYPATIVTEDPDGALEVADSIWERYAAAVAELEAVTALLVDLDAVEYQRNRCPADRDGERCCGRSGHFGTHWSTLRDGRWLQWRDGEAAAPQGG